MYSLLMNLKIICYSVICLEFREKAKDKAPWALEIYYKMGELMSDNNKIIREADEKTWAYKAAKKNTQSEN